MGNKVNSAEDEVWQEGLKEQLDKLPYTKHLDDGGYNDGQLAGFELGAQWGYNKCKEKYKLNTKKIKTKKMKAILEFDFEKDDYDRNRFEDAVDGTKWKSSMNELDDWLRDRMKYAPDGMSEKTYEAFEECREKIREIIRENNLSLYD